MKKFYVDSLSIIVTERCNLDCAHCLRGKKENRDITPDVVDAIFDQIGYVEVLNICGGEPTMATEMIEYIFNKIKEKKVYLNWLMITINGSIYNPEFMKLCEDMDSYIKSYNASGGVGISVSLDKYHMEDMIGRGLQYQNAIFDSPLFYGLRKLDDNDKLFREGNAEMLDPSITVPMHPMKTYIVDVSRKSEYLSYRIGPLVSINIDGTITEDNATHEHQETIYNYGNILRDNLVEALKAHGAKVLPSEFLYTILGNRQIKKYVGYKK